MLRETSAASTSSRSTSSAAALARGKAATPAKTRSNSALIKRMVTPHMSRSGYRVDGRAHTLIRPAATDIGDRRVDIRVSRFGVPLEQSHHRHHHAALTIAALWHVEIDPRLLDGMEAAVLRQRLDRGHLATAQTTDRHLAGARRRSVDVHGAGAALRNPAAIFGAGEP